MPIDPRARRRGRRPDDRRGGAGADGRDEGRDRRAADRHPHPDLGHGRERHPRRLPDVHARDRPGGSRTDGIETIEAIREAQGSATPTSRPMLGLSNISFGLNAGGAQSCSTRSSCTSASRPGSTPRSSTPRRSCRSPGSPRSSGRSRSTWSTTNGARATTRCSEFLELFADVKTADARASRAEELAALPLGERLQRRIIDGERNGLEADLDEALETGRAAARDRQRRPARGHEGRRRALRHGRDAAAVRAAVGRGDEDRGRLPRAAHGEDRRRGQGHHRARHRQGRRARHRQEPRRHHPDQQRLHRREPRHQAADQPHPRRGRGAPRRRDRHVRPARQEHRDHEGEPRGDQPRGAWATSGRCCSAAPP